MSIFQSPIRRVSGCNKAVHMCYLQLSLSFSPLYVGSVVVTELKDELYDEYWLNFQSPIRRVSGCNERLEAELGYRPKSFSPLYVGSVVVTQRYPGGGSHSRIPLSVPYTSGQWL
mgnify:CR=1 FL=1